MSRIPLLSRFKGRYLGLKVFSAFMAVLLWAYVSYEINPTTEQFLNRVPLETRNLDSQMTVVEMPTSVDVRIQGSREQVHQISVRSVEAYVDLKGTKTGENKVPVKVKLPQGIRVIEITPEEVTVNVDAVFEKQVPLVLQKFDSPAKGFKVLEPVFDPARVILKGPKSLLDNINAAVVKIKVTGFNEGFHGKMPVIVEDKQGKRVDENLISVSPQNVDLFLPVVANLPSKKVTIEPVVVGSPSPGYTVSSVVPEKTDITIFGTYEAITKIDKIKTMPISVMGASNDISRDLSLALPEGISTEQTSVTVLVKIVPENQ